MITKRIFPVRYLIVLLSILVLPAMAQPAAPGVTSSSNVTVSSFTANWNSVSGIDGYLLDVSVNSSFSTFVSGYQNKSISSSTPYASVTGLSPSTTYYYRVRALSYTTGTSGYSGNGTATTLSGIPAAPTATAASALTNVSFTANWAAVSNATSYLLYVSTSSSFSSYVSGYNGLSVSATNKPIINLLENTTYYYRVKAVNSYGSSPNSSTITTLTLLGAPIATGVSNYTGTSFTALWQPVTGTSTYYLDVSSASNFSSYVVNNQTVPGGTTSQSVTGLTNGTTYYFRVRAANASGSSISSNVITVAPLPAAPSVLPAGNITVNSFTANWNSSSGATSYLLDVSTASDFSTFVSGYNGVSAGVTNKSVTGLAANTTYYYRVRAQNGSGSSANSSAQAMITLPAAPTISAPSGMTVNSFVANWGSGSIQYQLDVSTVSSFATFVSGFNNLLLTNVTSKSVTGLTAGTTYYYRVRTLNASGASANSSVMTALTVSGAPVAITATSITATSFVANWAGAASATSYQLDVSTSNTFSTFVTGYNSLTVNSTNAAITNAINVATTSYYYRVRAVNSSGVSVNSNTIAVVAFPVAPQALVSTNITGSSFTANWNSVPASIEYRLDVSTDPQFSTLVMGYANAQALGNSLNVSGLTEKNTYYYRVRAVNTSGPSQASNIILGANFDENYVRTIDLLVAGKSTLASVEAAPLTNRTTSYSFVDGLGRVKQRVQMQGSPTQKDIVQPVAYDEYGREKMKYLPYTDGADGWYKTDALKDPLTTAVTDQDIYRSGRQYAFYQNGATVAADQYPYAETGFEPSPLNRIQKQGAPGAAWQPLSGDVLALADFTTKQRYEFNQPTDSIYFFKYDLTSQTLTLQTETFRAANTLSARKTYDEKNNLLIEFTDKEGRLLCKQIQYTTKADGTKLFARTYYIYDDLGNLAIVLPPPFPFAGITGMGIETKTNMLNRYAFQYHYDERQRLTHKKVPGADWVYMVYDNRDRLVMIQDGNQRLSNQWSYTKYDALNRPVITGIHTHSTAATQVQMQTNVNDYYSSLVLPGSTGAWYESFTTGPDGVHGYDNKSFPTICTPEDCLTVTYYDNYDFKSQWGTEYNYTTGELTPVTVPNDNSTYSQASASLQVVGQITGMKVRTIDAAPSGNIMYLKSAIYYDDKYRTVQTISGNSMGGTDRTTTLYDFVGKTLAVKTTHVHNNFTWNNPGWFTATSSTVAYTGGGAAGPIATVQQLPANSNGTVEFTAGTSQNRALVWLGSGTDYFYLEQGYYYVKENGVTQTSGLFTSGDEFRIERVAGAYRYYVRNNLVYTATATSTAAYPVTVNLDRFQSDPSSLVNFSASFAQTSRTIKRTFTYDHAGRLLTTHHSIDGATPILLAKNEYNELGQLVDKNLHSTDSGNTFKQSTDYRYNIRGWLTSINNADLTQGTINTDNSSYGKDLFGMELAYEKPITELTTASDAQYNGNISAIIYSNNQALGNIKSNGYKYAYDPLNRLLKAEFRQKITTWGLSSYVDASNQPQSAQAYSETGFNYDLNGNINKLKRSGAAGLGQLDDLQYTYNGNKLLSVTDAGDVSKGFIDGNTAGNDYSYDTNGNMTADANKAITTITYNHLNLPDKVTKTTGEYLKYTYDATGRKLSQSVFSATGELKKKSDYAGEYFYENDTLKFINHEEGRVVMVKEGQPIAPEYQYHLKDHLGNVRTTFTTKEETEQITATLETATAATEQSQFSNYSRVTNDLYDHTDAGSIYDKVQLLNGGNNSQVGLTKSLSVMPGDMITAEVYAKYFGTTGSSGNINAFATALLSAFGLPNPAVGEVGTASSAINNYGAFIAAGNNPGTNGWPKGWLNVLVFDKNYNLVDLAFQQLDGAYVQSGATKGPHQLLSQQVIIKEPGFVYIYVSNEGNMQQDVYFDDMKVTHTKSPVVQQDEYYPGGLTFNSYERENTVEQNNLYQGKELQDELGLNLYDFEWRQYDPTIWRTPTMDPMAEKFYGMSPYSWAANNPVRYVDPDGMIWKDPKEAERLKKSVEKTQGAVNKQREKILSKLDGGEEMSAGKRERLSNRLERLDSRLEGLETAKGDIQKLGDDPDHVYDLVGSPSGAEKHGVSKGEDGVINIGGPNSALQIHEIRHVSLSLGSEAGFQWSSTGSLKPVAADGQKDEIDAYRTQWSYNPSSVPNSPTTITGIDLVYLGGLKTSDGAPVYPALHQKWQLREQGLRSYKKYQRKQNRKK